MKTLIDEAITVSMRGGKQVFFFSMAAADAAASITARAGSCVASRLRHRKRSEDVVRFERIRIDLPSQKRTSQNVCFYCFFISHIFARKKVFVKSFIKSSMNNYIKVTDTLITEKTKKN